MVEHDWQDKRVLKQCVFNFMVMTLTSLCLKKTIVLQGKEYIMCFRRLHFDSIKTFSFLAED